MRRLVRPLPLLCIVVIGVLAPRSGAVEEDANRPVAALHEALRAMMEKKDAAFKECYVAIYETVAATHDFDVLTRDRVGQGWDGLDPEAKRRLENLLFKRIVSEYVVQLSGKDASGLSRGAARDVEGGGGLADLTLGGRTVALLRVQAEDDGWRITGVRWGGHDTGAQERKESARILAEGGTRALEEAWKGKVPVPSGPQGGERANPDGQGKSEWATRSPREIVDHLQDAIVSIMKEADQLGFEGRFEKFAPLISETHHLPAIAQATILRFWSKLDPQQRKAFVARFREFSIARYAGRFDGYSGEHFETKDVQEQDATTVVRSDLVKADGKRIRFDWVLRKIGGRWWILNIVVDGVSDLATKKEEYRSIFQKSGFSGLMEKLQEQIRAQREG
jgi:phospholipid transport system substrate-binding protein